MTAEFNENAMWNLCQSAYSRGYGIGHGVVSHETLDSVYREVMGHDGYNFDDSYGTSSELRTELPTVDRIHGWFNAVISDFLGEDADHIDRFGFRLFPAGRPATHIHRNSPFFGPWFFGLTITGVAPFYVFNNEDLEYEQTVQLQKGLETMVPVRAEDMMAGSMWSLYTDEWSAPHCGGNVSVTEGDRMVLLLYGDPYSDKAARKRRSSTVVI